MRQASGSLSRSQVSRRTVSRRRCRGGACGRCRWRGLPTGMRLPILGRQLGQAARQAVRRLLHLHHCTRGWTLRVPPAGLSERRQR